MSAIFVSADTVVFGLIAQQLHVLLVQRAAPPFAGQWALPGAELLPALDADLEQAARRRLREKTALTEVYLEQLFTVSGRTRDPRAYSVSTVFMALLRPDSCQLQAGDQVQDVAWRAVSEAAERGFLAFDHGEILTQALRRLRSKAEYTLLPALLLPESFTLPELERLYHDLIGAPCPNYTLRRRLTDGDWLIACEQTRLVGKKHTQLYRLKPERLAVVMEAIRGRTDIGA